MSQVIYLPIGQTGEAPEYTECQVIVPIADIHTLPKSSSPLETQRLLGQRVFVKLREKVKWLSCRTHYGVYGWIRAETVSRVLAETTHRVKRPTLVYVNPERKSPAAARLHPNSLVRAGVMTREYLAVGDGWVRIEDLEHKNIGRDDPVTLAARQEDTLYLWGGVTPDGFDCSGLMIFAFASLGYDLPHSARRIIEENEHLGGKLLPPTPATLGRLQRGDLVGWADHIGIMLSEDHIIHATCSGTTFCRVVIELLDSALRRRTQLGEAPLLGVRRPKYLRR